MSVAHNRIAHHRTALLAASVLMFGAVGTGCAAQPDVVQSTWQITDVYTTPDMPSQLPESVAGTATMVFGESTVAGFTGCSPFQGQVTFTHDGKPSLAADADHVSFNHMEIRDADCSGKERFFHDALVGMLDGDFALSRNEDETQSAELVLIKDGDEVDRPTIRLVD